MSRSLPVIHLEGTDFLVDLLRMEFRELTNPANRISFFELTDKGDHLVLHYNRNTRNAYRGTLPEKDKHRTVTIRIPPFKELDPFLFTLLKGRGDTRLDLLAKAIKLLSPPIIRHQRHKI
jgi:hypothetical protein